MDKVQKPNSTNRVIYIAFNTMPYFLYFDEILSTSTANKKASV